MHEKMLENVPAPVRAPQPIVPDNPEQPAGTVKRSLNFRDRLLLVTACRTFCRKDGKGSDGKVTMKLDRVVKLVKFTEVVDYFEEVDDRLEDAVWAWQKAKNIWLAYRNYQNGGISLQDLKLRIPGYDENWVPPDRPSRSKPESSPQDVRGPQISFFFPSRLDTWVQDVLKASTWDPLAAEFVTEFLAKFDIKEDD